MGHRVCPIRLNAHPRRAGWIAAQTRSGVAVKAETDALEHRRCNAYAEHPVLPRLEEPATLRQLTSNANARL